jgi:NIMA (never in mitosis gene a)-related kinase
LTKTRIVKLGDFGIARVLNQTVEKAVTMVGTPYYLSPEIIESHPYSFKTDIWSLGVILYELCALTPPFNADNIHALALKIVKGQFTPLSPKFSPELRDLVKSLLNVDPEKRPDVNTLLHNRYLKRTIESFLDKTVKLKELEHTALHNRPLLTKNDNIENLIE